VDAPAAHGTASILSFEKRVKIIGCIYSAKAILSCAMAGTIAGPHETDRKSRGAHTHTDVVTRNSARKQHSDAG
jgi:hypothetical protein